MSSAECAYQTLARWNGSLFSLSFVTNIVVTGLIAARLWYVPSLPSPRRPPHNSLAPSPPCPRASFTCPNPSTKPFQVPLARLGRAAVPLRARLPAHHRVRDDLLDRDPHRDRALLLGQQRLLHRLRPHRPAHRKPPLLNPPSYLLPTPFWSTLTPRAGHRPDDDHHHRRARADLLRGHDRRLHDARVHDPFHDAQHHAPLRVHRVRDGRRPRGLRHRPRRRQARGRRARDCYHLAVAPFAFASPRSLSPVEERRGQESGELWTDWRV